MTDAVGNTTTTSYDAVGRVVATTDAIGRIAETVQQIAAATAETGRATGMNRHSKVIIARVMKVMFSPLVVTR